MNQGEDAQKHADPRWTEKEDDLLSHWGARAYASESAYFARASTSLILNYVVGIPVVIVTTIVGTTIFTNQDSGNAASNVPVAVGVISVAAAVLASLQTFLRLGEKGAFNAEAGNTYARIRREIEQTLALPSGLRGPPKDTIEEIRNAMNQAGDKSPPIGQARWARWARRYGVKEPMPPRTLWERLLDRLSSKRLRDNSLPRRDLRGPATSPSEQQVRDGAEVDH